MLMLIQAGISCKWANDGHRLLLEYFDAICSSPSQIYHSALPFSPSSSQFHKYYTTELTQEVRVVKGLPAEWGMCSRTVILDDRPYALVYWKNTVAVGLGSRDIILLDGITGSQAAVLSGHTNWVKSLAFSSDGTSLVSGSCDKTIKLWDVQTGGVVKTFHGHTDAVLSVSISVDCTMITSGSSDKTIHLWDVQTRGCHCIIELQDPVGCVSFSPTNTQHFVSASAGKIQQWDIKGHWIKPMYEGLHTTSSDHVAFSTDNIWLISCQGADVVIQNSDSGAIVAKLHVDSGNATCCCFSPDGNLIAVAAGDTIYIWNVTSPGPHLIKTLVGHTNHISSLVFSSPSSLISSSYDKSVKFWQISALSADSDVTKSKSTPLPSPPIKSITLWAKDGIVISSDWDGVMRIWDISTGFRRASFQVPTEDPHQSDIRLIDSRLIFVWQANRKIHIWDVEKKKLLQTITGSIRNVEDIRISGDRSKIFCLSWSSVQAWSIQTGEVVGEVGLEICGHQRYLVVDGSRVWVHSPSWKPLGWDFGGSSPVQLSCILSLHHDSTKLWNVDLSRIEDTVTGKVFFQLAGRFANPVDVQWDEQYLVAGYESGEVLILDFNHMPLQ